MYILAQVIQYLFPLIALLLLIVGLRRHSLHYVISSLWLGLITLIIHVQVSGGQILGSYYNYSNATVYTLNLIIVFVALLRITLHLQTDNYVFKAVGSFINALIIIGTIIILSNLWINAFFIEHRMSKTPIMQVALYTKPNYCSYKYVFYEIANDGSVHYLCPYHYGLIPSIGHLSEAPDFITRQFIPQKAPNNSSSAPLLHP